jgi:hypothetical protein
VIPVDYPLKIVPDLTQNVGCKCFGLGLEYRWFPKIIGATFTLLFYFILFFRDRRPTKPTPNGIGATFSCDN